MSAVEQGAVVASNRKTDAVNSLSCLAALQLGNYPHKIQQNLVTAARHHFGKPVTVARITNAVTPLTGPRSQG
jgi:hypothetical protein